VYGRGGIESWSEPGVAPCGGAGSILAVVVRGNSGRHGGGIHAGGKLRQAEFGGLKRRESSSERFSQMRGPRPQRSPRTGRIKVMERRRRLGYGQGMGLWIHTARPRSSPETYVWARASAIRFSWRASYQLRYKRPGRRHFALVKREREQLSSHDIRVALHTWRGNTRLCCSDT